MIKVPFSTFAISGKAGSGKTTTAVGLCGDATRVQTRQGNNIIEWDKMALAQPLKEMIAIKRDISEADRRLYQLHSIVSGLYSDSPLYGAPPYDELVSMVHEIDKMGLGNYLDNYRSFQQNAADIIRAVDPDAFSKTLFNKAVLKTSEIDRATEEFELKGINYHRVLLVSDLRFDNEAEFFKKNLGVHIYELKASKEVRQSRLLERDGGLPSKKNMKHNGEQGISKKYVDLSIKTDTMVEADVIATIKKDIYKELGF